MAAGTQQWYATTIDNIEGANKITAALGQIEKVKVQKLSVHSYFWWDDKLDEADETRIQAYLSSADVSTEVEEAITKNHSDDVPMMINGGSEPQYPCVQIKATKVVDQLVGKTVVAKQLAGCAQYDQSDQTLYVKTTKEKSEALSKHLRGVLGADNVGEAEIINANKDYYDWLGLETTKKRPSAEL